MMIKQKKEALTRLTRFCKTNPENIKHLQKTLTKYLKTAALLAVDVAQESGDPIGKVLSDCLIELDDPTLLFDVYEKLPTDSIALRDVNWVITKHMVELAQQTPDDWSLLAETTATYAEALADMGKRELALSFAQQSACLYQRHIPHPDLDYLKSWVVFARCLMHMGHIQQATLVQMEVVAEYKQLSLPSNDENTVYYVDMMSILSSYYQMLEQHQKALETGLQALTLAKTLSLIKSQYRHAYHRTIRNLAGCYEAVDDLLEAKKLLKESVQMITDLKNESEDRYALEFIDSLEVLASVESRLGNKTQSLFYSKQAITYLKALYKSRPHAFLSDYTSLLVNMGLVDLANGDLPTAKKKMDNAIHLLEPLCQQFPLRFSANLAAVINNRIGVLLDLHEHEQAISDAKRVLALYRYMTAQQDKTTNTANIAMALNTLANAYMQSGVFIKAKKNMKASIALYHQLMRRDAIYRADLATTMGTLAAIYEHGGEISLALKTADKALAYWDESAESIRTANAESYHKVTKVRLACLIENVNYTQALSCSDAIVAHFQQHTHLGAQLCADALSLRSHLFSLLGDRNKAVAIAKEGIQYLRSLPIDEIPAYKADLADALGNLCFLLAEKDSKQALAVVSEAAILYESLPNEIFTPDMLSNKAVILQNQGSMAQECKQYTLSETSLQKAIFYQQQIMDLHEDYYYDLVTMLQLLINTQIYSNKHAKAIGTIRTLQSHLQRIRRTREITELLQDLDGVERSLVPTEGE